MSKLYKIRKLTSNNSTGDAHGITIPNNICGSFSNISFDVLNGEVEYHKLEVSIVDTINDTFKKISIEVPSEYYPQLKYHQIQMRESIKEMINPIKHDIILASGCNNK